MTLLGENLKILLFFLKFFSDYATGLIRLVLVCSSLEMNLILPCFPFPFFFGVDTDGVVLGGVDVLEGPVVESCSFISCSVSSPFSTDITMS